MKNTGEREYPRNEMDRAILKSSLNAHIGSAIYFSTLSWTEAQAVLSEVIHEMDKEVKSHDTFDRFYCELENK
jgi:hypothetical protein